MSTGRRKILVIDDSDVVLDVVRSALEGAGHDVVTHDRAAGAVALILHEKPDLVLMDVNMPGLGGDIVVSVYNRAQPNGDTIVLLHSSLGAESLRTKAESAGAHGYIQKTGDLYGLVRQVNRWLKRGSSSGKMRVAANLAERSADERLSSGSFAAAARASSGRFSAAMPVAPYAAPSPSSAAPENRRNSGSLRLDLPTVLLVDDDMAMLSAYRRHLQSDPFATEFALSGNQAMRRITATDSPDVVVCDLLLPDLSGEELYRRALEHDATYRRRFVVATGASALDEVSRFLNGFEGPILHKPIDPDQLRAALRRCLPQGRRFAG